MKPQPAEVVDARDGELDKFCRSNHHPYKTYANHVDLVGADLWNGVKDQKKKKSLRNARPRRGFVRVTTTKVHQPEPETRCEDSWLRSQAVLPSPLINSPTWLELRSAEVDAAVTQRELMKKWTTPRLVELTGTEALACRLAADFKVSVLRHDVFNRMLSWQPFLPSRCDYDDPVAAALQAAFWIRRLDTVTREKGWTATDEIEKYARGAFHPEGRVLKRYAPARRRFITRDDVAAANLVITHCNMILAKALTDRQRRWRAQQPNGNYTNDSNIVRLILDERRSAADVAREIGISGVVTALRFKAAIVAISRDVGPLSSRIRKFAREVEARARRTDKPGTLRIGDLPAPLPAPWTTCISPPASVLYGYPKEVVPDDRLLIGEALEYFGNVRVPSGCSAGYPVEPARVLDTKRQADPSDEEDSPIIGKTGALRTEGRYVILRPRAVDWRSIARKLSNVARAKALAKETDIADLLADEQWPPRPRWPSEPERRFAIRYFNRGEAKRPAPEADDFYCGPVHWRDSKLVPRFLNSKPSVVRDVVDTLSEAVSSLDQFTPLSD